MYLLGPNNTRIWTDSNRNFTLRQYGRLEYGTPDVGWIVASAKRSRPAAPKPPKRRGGVRVGDFLNAYPGVPAFDLNGPLGPPKLGGAPPFFVRDPPPP